MYYLVATKFSDTIFRPTHATHVSGVMLLSRDSYSSQGVLQPGCHHQSDFEYVRCGDKLKGKYKPHSKRRGMYHKEQHRPTSPKQRQPLNPSRYFSLPPVSARMSSSLPVTPTKVQIHAQRCFGLPRDGTRGGPWALSGRISGCPERSPPALTCHSWERHDAKVKGSRLSTESPTWREMTRSPEVLDLAAKLLYGEIILPAPRAKQVVDKHRRDILDGRGKGHQFDLVRAVIFLKFICLVRLEANVSHSNRIAGLIAKCAPVLVK